MKCWGEKKEILVFEDLRLQAKIHSGIQGITIGTVICVNRSDSNGPDCVVKQCKCSFLNTELLEGIFQLFHLKKASVFLQDRYG